MTDHGLYLMVFKGGPSKADFSYCTVEGLRNQYVYGPQPESFDSNYPYRDVYRLVSVIENELTYEHVGEISWNEFQKLQEISRVR